MKLYKNGWLEEHENQQLYCEKDKRFLADRYVEGTCPKCHYDVSQAYQQMGSLTERRIDPCLSRTPVLSPRSSLVA